VTRGDADPERSARDIPDTMPDDQLAAFRKQYRAWPKRVIRRGDAVRPLPPHARSLADLTFDVGDVRLSLGDYMARRRAAGLLILKDGEIAVERYGMDSGPETRWTSFSTAKSMTSTLCGAALHDGAIASLDDRCDLYLPRLRGSAYEGVTVRNVLRMCSGVAWREEDDARADAGGLSRALASRRPGAVLDLLCSMPRARPQGAVFNYSTGESCLLGALVAAATGRPLADTCAETIWRPAGMEADGDWLLEVAWRWAGSASARACATSAASASWCWRTRGVRWPAGPAARLARPRRPARQRAHGLRPADARLALGIRLPMLGAAARADRRPRRRLFGDRLFRPVHLRPSGRAGGRRHPERVAPA
jgi:CubicO group peptidase (beta-lactamase class C family)